LRYLFLVPFLLILSLQAQQIDIARIELLPNFPQPYDMRDWKNVALGYDSLVFNVDAQGTYLPLIWLDPAGVNYPGHERFGLDSYVGTKADKSAEAINILPAVISASLVGIDKSNQDDINWVLMCEDFFNNRIEENVYLDNYVTNSGSDWWYDTMPNIFFYQLYDLYPDQGDFERQFLLVADRWLEAVTKMGASQTPWKMPQMNYRAWKLATMTPLNSGVKEPEAAGAIAWLLFNAYLKTDSSKYRIGAEWAMEFLDARTVNPSYELQLPYGVYMAARMNAELNTQYDVGKLLNWCFTPDGNVRQWGMVTGDWGGYDAGGLIGEALYDGYAFAMNGYQQTGALLPMVKYDERFARAIGKWVLNCANASRLFYSKYLPDDHQDNESWTQTYDNNSVIAYEALREFDWFSSTSPYATGDAMRGGWGNTNLALYGSSHAGILGGIIDTTDIAGILQLDLNKTDYFNDRFSSYLYYNPHKQAKDVTITLPQGAFDLYESLSNSVIANNVSDNVLVSIPADQAIMLVLLPSGSDLEYQFNKTLVDGIVIDYNSSLDIDNYPPRIKSLKAAPGSISIADSVDIYCTAYDPDADNINYNWQVSAGQIVNNSEGHLRWLAPDSSAISIIRCIISDPAGASDSSEIFVNILNNHIPDIDDIYAASQIVAPGQNVLLTCIAHDDDDDPLTYTWKNDAGDSLGSGSVFNWQAPEANGFYLLTCVVTDPSAAIVSAIVGISVGNLVVRLPFNGNASDSSGFFNSGTVSGAENVTDRHGTNDEAFHLDGDDDYIAIANHQSLNFEDAITVHFWMLADTLFSDREIYPISHGNWENRWKVSIGNGKVRWTVKTKTAIRDLDSEILINAGKYYAISCTYDGSMMKLFINGLLSSSTTHTGKISTTSYDLILGQALPGNYSYGFKGIIDDLSIYNQALDEQEIADLFDIETTLYSESITPDKIYLYPNYPNPFNPQTVIKFSLDRQSFINLEIYDINGRKVSTLFKGIRRAGTYILRWNADLFASGVYFVHLATEGKNFVRKIVKIK